MKALVLPALLALAACAADPRPSDADRLNATGAEALAAGRSRAALARFSAAAESSAARDDQAQLSRDLHNRGLALLAAGNPGAAQGDLAESLRLAEAVRAEADDLLRTRVALATALAALGRDDEAATALAPGLADERSAEPLRARALASRAALAARRGDTAAARADLAAAGKLAGDDAGARGTVAVNRGHLALRGGDAAAAAAAYAEAAQAFREAGEQGGLVAALEGAARAAEAAGDHPAAARAWRRAAQIPHGGRDARDRRIAEALRLER